MKAIIVLFMAYVGLSQSTRLEFYKDVDYQGDSYVRGFVLPYVCFNLPEELRGEVSSVKFETSLGLSVYLSSELDCKGLTLRIEESVPDLGEVGFGKVAQSYKMRIFRNNE